MKKLLLLLLIVPLVFNGQNSKKDSIDHFKELLTEPMYGVSAKSFYKGYWIDTSVILKLAEATFGIPIFNSGPHTKEYFNSMCYCENFGHYNPFFLDRLIESIKSLSPSIKLLIQPLYDSHFKRPLGRLMQNKISDYFKGDSNKNLLEQTKNKGDHNSLLRKIESTNPDIPAETLFWIRRDFDGTSHKFLKLFKLIMEEFSELESEYYVSA